MDHGTVYLKLEKNIQMSGEQICLGELGEVNCSDKAAEKKVQALRFPTETIHGPGRYVFSVMDVIAVIQQEYPGLAVSNLGEADFIITVEKRSHPGAVMSWCKTILVCLLSFFGAAFSIMAFNNDVGITSLFGQLYQTFTGKASDGFTILEISYSIGVGLGILIFFHHFARKKGNADPTPLEVEMRTYEDEINSTIIEGDGRSK
jgi:stage V sporulation protein AA